MSDESQNTPSGQVPLKERVKTWPGILKNTDFAGQIDLSEKDLRALAQIVSTGFASPITTGQTHSTRVVFAVNCAYYAKDEGFWEYFCKLLNTEDTPTTQKHFGRKIEESLTHFGFLQRPRYGPFRCVGPILEQAGVTRRSIPKFASVLRQFGENGWDLALAIPYHRFVQVVEGLQPGTYLGYFLKNEDRSGWNFIRAVARNLNQLENCLLSRQELQGVPGYRPGFWKELQQHLAIEPPTPNPTSKPRAPLPRLVFDPKKSQVQLLFSHEWVERRVYFFDGETVGNSVWPLLAREDFKEPLHLKIKLERGGFNDVLLPGWALDRSHAIAIFHPAKGLIAPNTSVPLGPCCLLAPRGTRLPDSLVKLTDFEQVDLRDAEYVYWQVEITQQSNLKELGYSEASEGTSILSWVPGGTRFYDSIGAPEIFTNRLPLVRLERAELFRENRLGLFVAIGDKQQRITVPAGDQSAVDIPVPTAIPSEGRIWVEPLGRLRDGEAHYLSSELRFVLLPQCCFEWPSGLFATEDQPRFSFTGAGDFTLNFPDCAKVGSQTWTIPPATRFVEGTFQVGPLSLLVGKVIYRAEFGRDGKMGDCSFELADFDMDLSLRIRGIPTGPIRIGIQGLQTVASVDLGQQFDAAGSKRITAAYLRDFVQGYNGAAGVFVVWGGKSWVSTSARLINQKEIANWLFNNERTESPPWLDALHPSLSLWVTNVVRGLSVRTPIAPLQSPPGIPVGVERWVDEIELLLSVFASQGGVTTLAELNARKTDQLDPQLVEALRWFCQGRDLLQTGLSQDSSDGSELIVGYQLLKWRPPWFQWLEDFDALAASIRSQQALDPLISEWAVEARSPMRNQLTSRIGLQARGRDLTEAYIFSQGGGHERAYILAHNISEETPAGLTRDLALLLKHLLLAKKKLPIPPLNVEVHRKLRAYFLALPLLAMPHPFPVDQPAPLCPAPVRPELLPLNANDIDLLREALQRFTQR